MAIVRKGKDGWEVLKGIQVLPRKGEFHTTREIRYLDGRVIEEACEPYPVCDRVDIDKIEKLLLDDIWSESDMAIYGLERTEPYPGLDDDSKIVDGPLEIRETPEGKPVEYYPMRDRPPPPPPPTPEQKLANAGLTADEFDDLVEKSLARKQAKESKTDPSIEHLAREPNTD